MVPARHRGDVRVGSNSGLMPQQMIAISTTLFQSDYSDATQLALLNEFDKAADCCAHAK